MIRKSSKVTGNWRSVLYGLKPIKRSLCEFVDHFAELFVNEIFLKLDFKIVMERLILSKILDLIGQRVIFDTGDLILIKYSFNKDQIFKIEIKLFLIELSIAQIVDDQKVSRTVEDHLSIVDERKVLVELVLNVVLALDNCLGGKKEQTF